MTAGRVLNLSDLWTPTEKNQIIRASSATNKLRVGGTGSSKSSDALMEYFQDMCRWPGIHCLWIRRQWNELESSTVLHWQQFIPKELYDYHATKHIFTLKHNNSKLFLGHLENGEKDLDQYLSTAYPRINFDECGQISGKAYMWMKSRNRMNPECKPDSLGELPIPSMAGETNPIGPHWPFYRDMFVKKNPKDWVSEGALRDKNGRYWIKDATQKYGMALVYNPDDWDYVHSTILDNPHLMERDPDQYYKLQAMPPDLRDKFLYGSLDSTVGQFFDCWDADTHVVDLQTDPQAIIWQPWQPRWIGWDWGRAHWTAVYWFTIALVRDPGGEYSHKTVCYREHIDRGKDYQTLCEIIYRLNLNGLPGYSDPLHKDSSSLRRIFLSHEKFNSTLDSPQAPALIVSRYLSERGLPAATPFKALPGSRVQKAALLYDLLKTRKFVCLRNCTELAESIPSLTRDEDNIEDVLKTDSKADDVYDACSSGLYSWYGSSQTPKEELDRKKLEAIEDPFQRRLAQFKMTKEKEAQDRAVEDNNRPLWY